MEKTNLTAATASSPSGVSSPGGGGLSAARALRPSTLTRNAASPGAAAAAASSPSAAAADDGMTEEERRRSMITEFQSRKASLSEKLSTDKEQKAAALKKRLAERKRRIAAVKERQRAHDEKKKRGGAESPPKRMLSEESSSASPVASATPSPARLPSPTQAARAAAAAASDADAAAAALAAAAAATAAAPEPVEPLKSAIVEMCEASAYGQVERLKAALDRGSDDEYDESHNTPLHYAAGYGQSKCVRLLINSGFGFCCSVDLQGCTPLFWACASNQASVAKLLIKMDPDCIDYPNDIGDTPLHVAAQNRCGGCLQLLLESEADADALNDAGNSPAMLALAMSEEERHGAVSEGKWSSAELLRSLLQHGADPHGCNAEGSSLVHVAALRDDAECARALWEYHAWISPMAADAQGRTAVHVAAELGSCSVISFCIASEVDVFGLDTQMQTPQFVAEQHEQTEAVQLLAQHAASYTQHYEEQAYYEQQHYEQQEQARLMHQQQHYEQQHQPQRYEQQQQQQMYPHQQQQQVHHHQHQQHQQVSGGRYAQMLAQGHAGGGDPNAGRGYHSAGEAVPVGGNAAAQSWRSGAAGGGGYASESVIQKAPPNTDFLSALEGAYKKTEGDESERSARSGDGDATAGDDAAAALQSLLPAAGQSPLRRTTAVAPIATLPSGQQFTPRPQPRPEELAEQVVAPKDILASLQAAYDAEVID